MGLDFITKLCYLNFVLIMNKDKRSQLESLHTHLNIDNKEKGLENISKCLKSLNIAMNFKF